MNDGANPRGRPALAHTFQFIAQPLPSVPAQALQPPRRFNTDPVIGRGRPARAHEFQFYVGSTGIKTTVFGPYGAAGSATFILKLERGLAVSFGWQTSIIPSYSGKEQRESLFAMPQRAIDGQAFLVDAGSRDARGSIQRSAASGATFLLALTFEAMSFTADSSARTVFVTSNVADWMAVGQRVICIGPDGTTVTAVVQTSTSTTILLDIVPGAAARKGGLIMPLIQVLFGRQQSFVRRPVTVDMWTINARASIYGWCGLDQHGVGAFVTTFTVGAPVPASAISDFDLIVWDHRNAIAGTVPESADTGSEILDSGGPIVGAGAQTVPGWTRTVRLRGRQGAAWQFWKAFTRLCRGQQRAFLLSTNRPDLVYDSTITGGIKIKSSLVSGGGDYVSWYASAAHRRLAITMTNAVVQLVEVVTAPVDNLDGTLSLSLDVDVTGTPAKISFLELVRFAREDLVATWDGPTFEVVEPVVTVQEAVDAPSRNFFDKETALDFRYTGIPPDLPPSTQTLFVPFGKTILVHWTSDRTLSFGGIHMTGGNIDGTVVCVSVDNLDSHGTNFQNEEGTAAAGDRLQNSGLTAISGVARATWYRYRKAAGGGVGRWLQLM